jgi:predicted GTPase
MGKGEQELVLKEERLASILQDEYDKTTRALLANSPTILLLGATGAGKSSLINAVFGCKKAHVGAGKPVTKDFEFYEANDELSINLYDSKGHETNDATFNKKLYEFLDDRAKAMTNDITKGIHSVWCVIFHNKPLVLVYFF